LNFITKNDVKPEDVLKYKKELIEKENFNPLLQIIANPKVKGEKVISFCIDSANEIIQNALNAHDFNKLTIFRDQLEKINSDLLDLSINAINEQGNSSIIREKYNSINGMFQYVEGRLGIMKNEKEMQIVNSRV